MSYTRERMLLGDVTGDGLWVHCISRCVRKAFLAGDGFAHRKDLIEKRLRLLAEHAAVEVASYAVMSNHLHVVLRVRGDWAAQWDAESVVRRYYTVFPKSRDAQGNPVLPEASLFAAMVHNAESVAKWRARLADLGWIMRGLKEDIARRCNKEDGCSGAFWEGRYKSVVLLDTKALLACMAYVDLNPIRAKMADRPEKSTHTAARVRIRARQGHAAAKKLAASGDTQKAQETAVKCGLKAKPKHLEDGLWLTPLLQCVVKQEWQGGDTRGVAMLSPREQERLNARALSAEEYLTLLDATGRILRGDKRGAIPPELLPILQRLDIDLEAWLATMQGWREFLGRVVGDAAARLAAKATHSVQWLQNRCSLFVKRRQSKESAA